MSECGWVGEGVKWAGGVRKLVSSDTLSWLVKGRLSKHGIGGFRKARRWWWSLAHATECNARRLPLKLFALLLRHGPYCQNPGPICEQVEDPENPRKETIGGRKASWQRDHLFCHSGERSKSDFMFLSSGRRETMSGARRNGAARGLWEAEAIATRREAARGRGLCGRKADALHASAARKVRSSHRAASGRIIVCVESGVSQGRSVQVTKKIEAKIPKIPPKMTLKSIFSTFNIRHGPASGQL